MRVVVFAKIKRDRCAGVHEHPVAIAAEKERNRFVHVFVLRAHAVSGEDVNVLTSLVESRKRLAASEYFLVVL